MAEATETRVDPTRSRRGRERLFCSVRPAVKRKLEERAIESDDSLSGYAARVLAKHVGMEP